MALVIGVVGLGIMGGAFSANMLKNGQTVVGYDPVEAMRARFAAAGGKPLGSPKEVGEAADVVITSLPSVAALRMVMEGPDGLSSIASAKKPIVMECGTLPLAEKTRAYDALAKVGITLLDCPVSGTGAQAAAGDLIVMGSGDEAAYKTCQAFLPTFSKSNFYVGPFGNGMKMKVVANILVGIHNAAAAEALAVATKAGLDPQMVYDVIKDGAGTSRMFQVRGPMMVKRTYSPVTATNTMYKKDIEVITDYIRSINAPAPLFGTVAQLYAATLAQGLEGEDTAAVFEVIADMAGLPKR